MAQLFFVSVQPKVARRQGLEESLRCIGTPLTACTTGPESTPHGHRPAKLFLLNGVQPSAPSAKELDDASITSARRWQQVASFTHLTDMTGLRHMGACM